MSRPLLSDSSNLKPKGNSMKTKTVIPADVARKCVANAVAAYKSAPTQVAFDNIIATAMRGGMSRKSATREAVRAVGSSIHVRGL